MLEIWRGIASLAPLFLPVVAKRKNSRLLSLLDVQSSTDKKLAKTQDTAKLLMKSNIVSIGCYVWLMPARLLTNTDCLLKLYDVS